MQAIELVVGVRGGVPVGVDRLGPVAGRVVEVFRHPQQRVGHLDEPVQRIVRVGGREAVRVGRGGHVPGGIIGCASGVAQGVSRGHYAFQVVVGKGRGVAPLISGRGHGAVCVVRS